MTNKYTTEEDEEIKIFFALEPRPIVKFLANKLNRSVDGIRNRANELGVFTRIDTKVFNGYVGAKLDKESINWLMSECRRLNLSQSDIIRTCIKNEMSRRGNIDLEPKDEFDSECHRLLQGAI